KSSAKDWDRLFIRERAMKVGRNDPCPCGSGKKYKKCCLPKDQATSATQPAAVLPPPAMTRSPRADSSRSQPEGSDRSSPLAHATKAPRPPSPPNPVRERAERRWQEFESQSEEGRIALFIETLDDAEVMTDDMAFEMLNRLHSEAVNRGDRLRFSEWVGALREHRPQAYESSAHYYLSWRI